MEGLLARAWHDPVCTWLRDGGGLDQESDNKREKRNLSAI
jgi:hypothetical protein